MRRSDEVILPRIDKRDVHADTLAAHPIIVRPIAALDNALKILGVKGESHVAF